MPWCKQIGRASAVRRLSRRPLPPFACGNGYLPLPKLIKSTALTGRSSVSGEYRRTGARYFFRARPMTTRLHSNLHISSKTAGFLMLVFMGATASNAFSSPIITLDGNVTRASGSALEAARVLAPIVAVVVTKAAFGNEASAEAMALPPSKKDPPGGGTRKGLLAATAKATDEDTNTKGVTGKATVTSVAHIGFIFDTANVIPNVTNFDFVTGFARAATTYDVRFQQGPTLSSCFFTTD